MAVKTHIVPSHALRDIVSLLAVVLPGCEAAVYLNEGGNGVLRLSDHTAPDNRFAAAVTWDKLSFNLKGNDKKLPHSLVPSEKDAGHFLTKAALKKGVSLMASPILAGKELHGLLVVAFPSAGASPSPLARREMQVVARIVQLNLAREEKIGSLQTYNDFLSGFMARARRLDITTPQNKILEIIGESARESINFNLLTISMRDPASVKTLNVVWTRGKQGAMKKGSGFVAKGVLHGEVYLQARALSNDNIADGKYSGRFVPGDVEQAKLRSFIGVPVVEAGVARGTIALEGVREGQFSAFDLQLLGDISRIYGTALCWASRYQQIHDRATIDGLTELLNSHSFLQRISEELERDVRYGNEMTMLMLDIDNFKLVNDTHGHPYGDYVIRQTAQLIRHSIRVADVAGRLGGEEFGVVIINSDSSKSRKTAERIRRSIADYNFSNQGIDSRITISIGMSEYPVHGKNVKEIVKRADQAMYVVKNSGGNGVKSFGEIKK
ncbi:MAG: GGDEF domain-containing protein [Candidatus Marinimicrobia bacterium]|nr:GGDEF domain-containing protein [Candidatus Neomarinimicrobiota bacterium]